MPEIFESKRYGLRSSLFVIAIGSALTLFFLLVNLLLGLLVFLCVYTVLANVLSLIEVTDDIIRINDFIIPFKKGKKFQTSEVEKIIIRPGDQIGQTNYVFYSRDGGVFVTFNMLFWFERKKLVKKLKSMGVQVVDYDWFGM